jgi:hypothetical protein
VQNAELLIVEAGGALLTIGLVLFAPDEIIV